MKKRCQMLFLNKTPDIGILCFIALLGFCNGSECNENLYIKHAGPLVETSTGAVAGKYIDVLGTQVTAFLGIPFAEPPLADKRFKKANPISKWEGTLVATENPPACVQFSSRNFEWIPTKINSSEDCLYLNIWTPAKCCCNSLNKVPVMVWIHGGAYSAGSASMDIYEGNVLASRGEVVVVSINYRLGVFGFLNSGSSEAPGNAGLHDQLVALQWIKENIHNFGGDPNSITLFGESAGAISVSLHMISPLSRDLFHKAIMQSGTIHHPHLFDNSNVAAFKANTLAKVVGCSGEQSNIMNNPSGVVSCLKNKDPSELARAEDIFTSKFPYYFAPSLGNDFLPDSPIKLSKSGKISQIPALVGGNKDEGAIFLAYLMPEIFAVDQDVKLSVSQAKSILDGLFASAPEVSTKLVFENYFRNITEDGSGDIVQALSDAFGDYVFNCPDVFFAENLQDSYLYWNTHRSLKESNKDWVGVPHFYEVNFVFGKPLVDNNRYTLEDEKFSEGLIQKWASFAREGHPLGKNGRQTWPKYSSSTPLAYELNPKSERCINFPRKGACDFWRPYFLES